MSRHERIYPHRDGRYKIAAADGHMTIIAVPFGRIRGTLWERTAT